MSRILVTAQVDDANHWEAAFRTHGDLFRRQTVSKPIEMSITDGNNVAVCFEPENMEKFWEIFNSPDTAAAMAEDGVKRETVKVFVLDKQFVL